MIGLEVALQFSVLMLTGMFMVKSGLFPKEFRKQLANMVMNISLPCMIARSIYNQDADFADYRLVPVAAVAALFMLFLGGEAVYLLLRRDEAGKSARFSMMFGNFTFMGFPAVETLFGADGLFVFTLFTLPIRLVFYASPSLMLAPGGSRVPTGKELLKQLLSPPTVSVFAGLLLHALPFSMPGFLDKAIASVGGTASVLGMLIVGMSLSEVSLKTLLKRRRALWIVAGKAVISPLLLLATLLFFPLDSFVKQAIFVYGSLPLPSLLTTFSVSLGRSEDACEDASAAVLVSTLLSVVTIPFWTGIGSIL